MFTELKITLKKVFINKVEENRHGPTNNISKNKNIYKKLTNALTTLDEMLPQAANNAGSVVRIGYDRH